MSDDQDWRGFPIALGSSPGSAELHHHPDESRFDSFLSASGYGRSLFAELSTPTVGKTVDVKRLDDVVQQAAPSSNRMLLKADTQGYDLEVLRGASGCLHQLVSLQIELAALTLYEDMASFGNTVEEIMALGFYPVGFFPVLYDGVRVVEFDGLFVRADDA